MIGCLDNDGDGVMENQKAANRELKISAPLSLT